jgi:hypothetical protein
MLKGMLAATSNVASAGVPADIVGVSKSEAMSSAERVSVCTGDVRSRPAKYSAVPVTQVAEPRPLGVATRWIVQEMDGSEEADVSIRAGAVRSARRAMVTLPPGPVESPQATAATTAAV